MKALIVVPSRGRHARRRPGVIILGARRLPPVPAPQQIREIGLGSRPGDKDWLGYERVFSADHDMGEWRPSAASDLVRNLRYPPGFAAD